MSTCQENGHYCPNCDTSFPAESNLLRENAELRASHARLREVAIAFANESPQEGDYALLLLSLTANASDETRIMIEDYGVKRKALTGVLAELPAASLAAITAPLEAHIAELSSAAQQLVSVTEFTGLRRFIEPVARLQKVLARTPAQSLIRGRK